MLHVEILPRCPSRLLLVITAPAIYVAVVAVVVACQRVNWSAVDHMTSRGISSITNTLVSTVGLWMLDSHCAPDKKKPSPNQIVSRLDVIREKPGQKPCIMM